MAKKETWFSLEAIERETAKLVEDLAFCARSPVSVQLKEGPHLAFTIPSLEKNRTIEITMNPTVVADVRNQERAVQIWRGMGFHELAHNMWPKIEQYKSAAKDGFKDLFNLIDDEQNERKGRALDPAWGACFQTMCAHIFPYNNRDKHEELCTGHAHAGDHKHKPKGKAATKVYTSRWNLFAWHLRRGVPDPSDPVVAEALQLIPRRFKDLTADELLDLTRKVHETLLRGIELPVQLTKEKSGKDQNDQSESAEDDDCDNESDDEPDQEDQDQDEPDDADAQEDQDSESDDSEKVSWHLRRLLRSKWLYIPFVALVLGWCALFMQGSIETWVGIAIGTIFGTAIVVAILFLRRAFIKSLLKQSANQVAGGINRGSQWWEQANEGQKRLTIGLLAVPVCLVIALIVLLAYSIYGPPLACLAFIAIALVGTMTVSARLRKTQSVIATTVGSIQTAGSSQRMSVAASLALAALFLACVSWVLLTIGWSTIFIGLAILLVSACSLPLLVKILQPRQTFRRTKKAKTKAKRLSKRLDKAVEAASNVVVRVVKTVILPAIIKVRQGVKSALVAVGRFLFIIYSVIVRAVKAARRLLGPPLRKLWRNTYFRLTVLAIPVAALIMMIYALAVTAGNHSWWMLLILIALLLLLLAAAFIFRKQIKEFVLTELLMPMPSLMDYMMLPPLDMTTELFRCLNNVQPVAPNQAILDRLLPQVYPLAQQLRPFISSCGSTTIDRENEPEGYDLIDEIELSLMGESAVFVDEGTRAKANVYIGVGVDCSSSMLSPTDSLGPGEKFELAKLFALIIEQACLGVPGVSAHFWGFTDTVIYDCGALGDGGSSGLQCGGGNNDAAMLSHMGESAAASGKDVKILLMLSDGQPSACSWLSLKNLVVQLEQEGMIPWNFGLDVINTPAFERYFTDLVGQSQIESIMTMGQTLASIAEGVR